MRVNKGRDSWTRNYVSVHGTRGNINGEEAIIHIQPTSAAKILGNYQCLQLCAVKQQMPILITGNLSNKYLPVQFCISHTSLNTSKYVTHFVGSLITITANTSLVTNLLWCLN